MTTLPRQYISMRFQHLKIQIVYSTLFSCRFIVGGDSLEGQILETAVYFYARIYSTFHFWGVCHLFFPIYKNLKSFKGTNLYRIPKIGLPTKKSKVLRLQICFTRTKYLSEIYKKRTIKVGAAKLFSVNSSSS